ncbi:MAG: ATP-binding protein [Clostridium sp.]
MKLNKYLLLGGLFILFLFLQYFFRFDVYVLLVLMVLAFALLWEIVDRNSMNIHQKENIELQKEIKSTAKDAHLKNKQLLTVVTSIPFPLMLLDQNGNVVMHNNINSLFIKDEKTENMTYMDDCYERSVSEFIKDAFILEKPMDKIINIKGVEYQSISVPVTAKNKYSGCLVLFQDISKALEGEKMQKRFIADASHELKTPIAVIKGMVEILNREDFDDDATRKEFMGQIEHEINRLDILVKDLLQLSRLSMSTVLLEREKTDLCQVIDKAIKSLSKKAERKNLTIVSDYQTHEQVFCDPLKMSQVILNLLSNAIKYSDTGTITLCTKTDDEYYIVEVCDEGHGIKPSDQEKIFERFYRVDDDRSRETGGSGLGLSIVKSIIDAHHGVIEVQSEFNTGTTFTIKLKR